MNSTELIAELTGICTRQAESIRDQAYALEQFGAQVREEEVLAERNRLRAVKLRPAILRAAPRQGSPKNCF